MHTAKVFIAFLCVEKYIFPSKWSVNTWKIYIWVIDFQIYAYITKAWSKHAFIGMYCQTYMDPILNESESN